VPMVCRRSHVASVRAVARIAADAVTVNRLRYLESDFAPSGHETARPNLAACAGNTG